jgi:peptidoglycan-associated lipoprotein
VLTTIYKPIQVENIFYEFGKWDLTPASENGLQALVKILTDNPNITIEISAHTDFVGNNESNRELSAKRAQSVVDYLIQAGIVQNRLTSVGYGEEKPFVVDAATAGKYDFLKENDVLTEEFILKLTPAQQEQANQINRRTEFRVFKTTYK